MFPAIAKMRQARANRKELEHLRERLRDCEEFLDDDNATFAARMGSLIRDRLERHFGAEPVTSIGSDVDLMREDKLLDAFPPKTLAEISGKLTVEVFDKELTDDDYAPETSLLLLSGWLKAKALQRRSPDAEIVAQAQELAGLYFSHIRNLLGIARKADRT